LAQNRGMWVSQMIRNTTPFEIGNGVNHVTQGNAITKSVKPLTCILSRVALRLDTSDDPATGCDLQLLAGLNSLKEGGKVLPQIGFGNVLGSSGSVIPKFKEQIAKGGPVTVTYPDIIRYFMTIPETARLVLQAAAIGNSGQVLVLDMGEPVRVVDLARDLIRLAGYTTDEIAIEFTGLRPGEKLFEELLADADTSVPMALPRLLVAAAGLTGAGLGVAARSGPRRVGRQAGACVAGAAGGGLCAWSGAAAARTQLKCRLLSSAKARSSRSAAEGLEEAVSPTVSRRSTSQPARWARRRKAVSVRIQ